MRLRYKRIKFVLVCVRARVVCVPNGIYVKVCVPNRMEK